MKQVRRPLYPLQKRAQPEEADVPKALGLMEQKFKIIKDVVVATGISMADAARAMNRLCSILPEVSKTDPEELNKAIGNIHHPNCRSTSVPLVDTGELKKAISKKEGRWNQWLRTRMMQRGR